MRNRLCLVLALMIPIVLPGLAQEDKQAEAKRKPVTGALAGDASIEIVREPATSSAPGLELVPREGYRKGGGKPPPGNTAFLSIVHKEGKKSLGWVAYDSYNEGTFPAPAWSADVAWDPRRQEAIVAVCRTLGPSLKLDLYRVSVGGREVPARIDQTDHRSWPPASVPFASFQADRGTGRLGDVGRVVLVPERSTLMVVLERSHPDDEPLYLRFGLDTKRWTWARLLEEPAEPGK